MCFDLKTREHKNNIFSFAFKEIKINLLNRYEMVICHYVIGMK